MLCLLPLKQENEPTAYLLTKAFPANVSDMYECCHHVIMQQRKINFRWLQKWEVRKTGKRKKSPRE